MKKTFRVWRSADSAQPLALRGSLKSLAAHVQPFLALLALYHVTSLSPIEYDSVRLLRERFKTTFLQILNQMLTHFASLKRSNRRVISSCKFVCIGDDKRVTSHPSQLYLFRWQFCKRVLSVNKVR